MRLCSCFMSLPSGSADGPKTNKDKVCKYKTANSFQSGYRCISCWCQKMSGYLIQCSSHILQHVDTPPLKQWNDQNVPLAQEAAEKKELGSKRLTQLVVSYHITWADGGTTYGHGRWSAHWQCLAWSVTRRPISAYTAHQTCGRQVPAATSILESQRPGQATHRLLQLPDQFTTSKKQCLQTKRLHATQIQTFTSSKFRCLQ